MEFTILPKCTASPGNTYWTELITQVITEEDASGQLGKTVYLQLAKQQLTMNLVSPRLGLLSGDLRGLSSVLEKALKDC